MESVYKIIELVGTSEKSWEDAANNIIEKATKTLEDLRIAEIKEMDIKLDEGKPIYRVRAHLSFKYRGEG